MDTQTPEGYAALRQHEIDGTGFASPDQTPWPAQQAANTAAMNQAAAAAAKIDAANKARQSFPNVKHSRAKGAK